MGDIRWYKRDPDAALAGMAELTLEERGAYNTVLDLIYSTAGNLHDNDREIAGWLRCDIRIWRRIRRRLVELGKLYLHAGMLRNGRADREIYAMQHRVLSAAEAGRSSWRTRKEKGSILNGWNRASVQTTVRTTQKERKKERDLTESLEGKSKEDANRGSKLGDVTDALAETIKRKGWTQ